MVGYFTINSKVQQGFIDWDWLLQQASLEEKKYTRHLHFQNAVVVKINGHQNKGIILKPTDHLG
jgi:hypothetical protein